MQQKREVAAFVPYRKVGDPFEFFLQMRDLDALTNPNVFGLFGGGLEKGESPEEALTREIQEELKYTPKTAVYFSRYEHATGISHMFVEEVGKDFESEVDVCEGQYGRFLTLEEVQQISRVTDMTRVRITQLSDYLNNK